MTADKCVNVLYMLIMVHVKDHIYKLLQSIDK